MKNLTVYSEEELRKIQKLELTLLKEIIEICVQENIEYFLIGGTALGAVRHGGFIPWDDDIDVGMTRENYNKFLNIAPKRLSSDYHLQTPYNSKNCPYFYSKIRIDNTVFMEYCNRNIDMHQGVYIDIFPFDEVPDDEGKNKEQFEKVQKLIRVFTLRQSPDVSQEPETLKDKVRSALRRAANALYKLTSYNKLLNTLDDNVTQYNGTGQSAVACLNFPIRKKEYVKKTDLYPLADCKFEDTVAKIPGNYDEYLRTHYGDYMKLPPQKDRYGHKPYKVELGDNKTE